MRLSCLTDSTCFMKSLSLVCNSFPKSIKLIILIEKKFQSKLLKLLNGCKVKTEIGWFFKGLFHSDFLKSSSSQENTNDLNEKQNAHKNEHSWKSLVFRAEVFTNLCNYFEFSRNFVFHFGFLYDFQSVFSLRDFIFDYTPEFFKLGSPFYLHPI